MTIEFIQAAVTERPHTPLAVRLAENSLAWKNISEAKELCRSALSNYPHYTTAHLILARCLAGENNYEEAVVRLNEALRYLPGNSLLEELRTEWQKELAQEPSPSGPHEESQTDDVAIGVPVQQPEENPPATPLESLPDVSVPSDVQAEPAEILQPELPELPPPEPVTAEILLPLEQAQSSVGDVDDVPAVKEEISEPQAVNIQGPNFPEPALQPSTEHSENDQPSSSPDQPIVNESSLDEPVATVENSLEEMQDTETQEPQRDAVNSAEEVIATNIVVADVPRSVGTKEPVVVSARTDEGRIVSKTLADIYVKQGAYEEAIITYRLLKQRRPETAAECDQQISDLELKLKQKSSS